MPPERQLTSAAHGHILTNFGVWSPDSRQIVYDVRSDPAGDQFDGTRIETVDSMTGTVTVLYESRQRAKCGVATFHPTEDRVAFIHGPENPTADWQYGPYHRRGVLVDTARPGIALNLDARDLAAPFTPGALRGGSHVHIFSGDGRLVSFTYEDHVLAAFRDESDDREVNLRNVGVTVMGKPVVVGRGHPRNHDGSFTVIVTRTTAQPKAGSDEIQRAFEDAWVGTNGYVRPDGSRQERALAFLGHVRDSNGTVVTELFVIDLPSDLTRPGDGPLEGTTTRRPRPPRGTVQRRLTHTSGQKYPGIHGPRHWPRSSPDGSRIAFLMRDDAGVAQIWAVSPNGGPPTQITRNPCAIGSAFTWTPDGQSIAHVMDNSVCVTDVRSGVTTRLTPRSSDATAPRPEACVVSPSGSLVAYVRPVISDGATWNQVFCCSVK